MKKVVLIVLLLFTAVGFGQIKYLTAGDSILVHQRTRATYTLVFISDSSNSIVDTCVIEAYAPNKKIWSPVAVMDLATHDDWYSEVIPGDGSSGWYLINYIAASDNIRIRKTNVVAASLVPSTYVEFNDR